MEQAKSSRGCLRFGVFEADLAAMELRKNGVRVKLQDQPFQVLVILLEHPGEVIPREELRRKLWTADTFVDFDNGLNTAINKIREVLGDSAENPRFVRTLPRRGYRFIAPVDGFTKPAPSPSRRLRLAFVATGSLTVLLAIAGLYLFIARHRASPPPALTVTRLTSSGNLAGAAISQDGKYLAYVIADGDQQSLRILQIGTASDVQLLSPANTVYRGVTFSPDSSYVYYTRGQWKAQPALYRIPVLGGVPAKLIEDMDSPAGISPDGKQVAFVHYDSTKGTQVVVIANPDGSGEHRVATAKYPEEEFYEAPVWSPDGKLLAIWQRTNLLAIPVSGGPAKVIVSKWVHMPSSPAWLGDGSGLIVAAAPLTQSSNHSQLWRISYPDGKTTPILPDPYRYGQVSLTGDSHTLVAEQIDERSNIWVAPASDPDRARLVTTITGHFVGGGGGVTWTPDGHILYSSNAKANFEFWTTNPDGTSARPLPLDRGRKGFPSVCPDGRTVVFHAPRDNRWIVARADLEGGRSQALADGLFPSCSRDGKWVLFKSENGLQKVSLEGGEPIELTDQPCGMFAISPNGEQIACLYRSGHNRYASLVIIPSFGGKPTKVLDLSAKIMDWLRISWTPDGQAVAFIVGERDGVGNVWVQPVAGGPPRQLTHFTSDGIQTFDWSRDGRHVAFSRSTETVDAVLITNFR
jgi:Tol biopolymer transport system component/DNA-binding winged helix-turn-helix (wHTH) protein